MNRNGFFFLIFAIVVALMFTWLNSTWLSFKGFNFTKKEKKVDYYLSDFTLLNTYPDGSMRYNLKGQYLIHQQSSGASTIFNPNITARDRDENFVRLTAKLATQNRKNGPIYLTDTVKVEKTGNIEAQNFQIVTKDITYNPLEKLISSEAKLEFLSNSGNFSGVGFSTTLDNKELRIHKNAQAVFKPAK